MKNPIQGLVLVVLVLATALTPAPVRGQEADDERWLPEWGDWSLSFTLPGGGGSGFGLWRQGQNMALGFDVDASFSHVELDQSGGTLTGTQIALAIGPALRRYWWQDGPVAPFFGVGLDAIYQRTSSGPASSWRIGGGLDLGLGAEWFPLEGVGIGGFTGARGTYFWTTDDDEVADDEVRIAADLFTSALSLRIYF